MRRYCHVLVKVEMAGSDTIDTLSDLSVYLTDYIENEDGYVKLEHVIETFEPARSNYPLENLTDENIKDLITRHDTEVKSWREYQDRMSRKKG